MEGTTGRMGWRARRGGWDGGHDGGMGSWERAFGTRTHLELEQPGEQVPAELAQRLLLDLQTREHVFGGRVRGCRDVALAGGRRFGRARAAHDNNAAIWSPAPIEI